MCIGIVCSCLGSACIGCCCSSLSDCKVKHGPGSRIPYIFIMFILCIFAVIMTLYGDTELYENDLLDLSIVVCDEDENEACQANGSVYRVSFCLFLFFIIHAAVVKGVASFHWLFFAMKLFILCGVLALTYWLPNAIFDGYADFARIASFVFLLLQVVILISWAYDVNDRVIARVDEMSQSLEEDGSDKAHKAGLCCIQFGLIMATIVVYVAIIVFVIFFFTWFDPSKCDDTFNSSIIGLTIVLVLVMSVLPIMLQTGSIFTTAVVSFYVTYLCFAGLENVPNEECNTFAEDKSTSTMWIGIIVTAIAISYIGFSVSKNSAVLLSNDDSEINMELEAGTNKKQGTDTGDDAGTADKSNYDDDADLGESNYDDAEKTGNSRGKADISESALEVDQKANVLFHLCMAFASIYMAMLYTNWGTNTVNSDIAHGRSWESVWINIAAQWVTCVLFIWTAVAPKLCPGRFGFQSEDE